MITHLRNIVLLQSQRESSAFAEQVRQAGFSLTIVLSDSKIQPVADFACYAAVAWMDDTMAIAAGRRFAGLYGVPLLGMISLTQCNDPSTKADVLPWGNAEAKEIDGTLWSTMSPSQLLWEVEQARIRTMKRKELEYKLREAIQDVNNRKVIERAKGYLMDRFGLKESDAYRRLQEQAMRHRKSMKEIAEQVLLLSDITEV